MIFKSMFIFLFFYFLIINFKGKDCNTHIIVHLKKEKYKNVMFLMFKNNI